MRDAAQEHALRFRSRDDLWLEGVLDLPPEPHGALVICHAHPDMGGTMKSPLLVAVKDEMVGRGWAVVRFNFRGVEGSEGLRSTGVAEVADADGAIRLARERFPNVPIAILGWSFGAAVALRAAALQNDLEAAVAIAPAVRNKPQITDGLPPARELNLAIPILVIVGSNDHLVAPADCRAWADDAGARYVEIKAANHFFWAKYEPLVHEVGSFLADVE